MIVYKMLYGGSQSIFLSLFRVDMAAAGFSEMDTKRLKR